MKLSICELPDKLTLQHPAWVDLCARIADAQPDLAVLNEMPFGPWVAQQPEFYPAEAAASMEAHYAALTALHVMGSAVLTSRPVAGPQKMSNEAFIADGGVYRPIHHKHYFPEEPGFFERTWFAPQQPGFDVVTYKGLRIGVLLCTELMFTEWARHYRRQGAHVIVAPRASGQRMTHWNAAAAMAAVVSGCYVLSSNRAADGTGTGLNFGGRGFAYSPFGELLAETSAANPFCCVDLDLDLVAEAQQSYPCYVQEI